MKKKEWLKVKVLLLKPTVLYSLDCLFLKLLVSLEIKNKLKSRPALKSVSTLKINYFVKRRGQKRKQHRRNGHMVSITVQIQKELQLF